MNSASTTIIKGAVGAVMVAYGFSQIKYPKSWFSYVPNWVENVLPVSTDTFMRSHGAINVGLGLLFVSHKSMYFVSWATFAWWLSILPFAAMKDWRMGARDAAIVASVLAVALSIAKRP